MAKPKPATDLVSSATSPSGSQSTKRTSSRHRPHRSRRHCSSTLLPIPSAGLLASLATVAASCSTADGRPLDADSQPPDFLYPFLPLDAPEAYELPAASGSTSHLVSGDAFNLSPTPTRSRRGARRRDFVADKYIQGDDGRWRKEHSWSLYGSSYCECTQEPPPPPETAVPEVDDQISPTQLASDPLPTASPSPSKMANTLPSGWPSKSSTSRTVLTPIILTMSLLLALLICVFIFGCVAWRRKRRAYAHRDLDKERRLASDGGDIESEELKKARTHQKMWARATARWKANVRMSARRRRKRPHSIASTTQDEGPNMSTVSLTSQYSYASPSSIAGRRSTDFHPDSRPVTPVSTQSVHTSRNTLTGGETEHVEERAISSDVPVGSSRLTLPPEYPVDGTLPGARARRLGQPIQRLTTPDLGAPVVDPAATNTQSATSSQDHLPYTGPVNSAHIATDDKALLARMANLASQPPQDGSPCEIPFHGDSAASSGPSVPIMDEFEEMPVMLSVVDEEGAPSGSTSAWPPTVAMSPGRDSLSIRIPVPTYSREPSPHPPLFPAPPSKAQLAAPDFYEYPSSFEREDATHPDIDMDIEVPSAPPFELGDATGPSAPPLDDGSTPTVESSFACAPPLIEEEEEIQLGFIHAGASPEDIARRQGASANELRGSPLARQRRTPSPSPPTSRGRASTSASSSAPHATQAVNPPDYLP